MAELTTDELKGMIAHQARELDAIKAREQRQATDAAIAAALGTAGVELQPGAQGQLVGLLRDEISLIPHNGGMVPVGPNLKPVDQHIRERLTSADFAHFVKSSKAGSAVGATGQAGAMLAEQGSDESLGSYIMRRAIEQRTARETTHGPASQDMSRSFGLRRTS